MPHAQTSLENEEAGSSPCSGALPEHSFELTSPHGQVLINLTKTCFFGWLPIEVIEKKWDIGCPLAFVTGF
jgi:hypothetical protein